MKKLFMGIFAVLLGFVAYFVTFSAFYDAWFPYYYEDYIIYLFIGGVAVILLVPIAIALLKSKAPINAAAGGYLPAYYQAILGVNSVVVIVCVCTFIYMLSHGTYLGGTGSATYMVKPIEK